MKTIGTGVRNLVLGMVLVVLPTICLAERGVIGVYVDQHRGKPTASGELYQPGGFTAAHLTLPLGSMVRVENESTGQMVNVRINDRKTRDGRVIYLSNAAGKAIGLRPGQTTSGRVTIQPPFAAPGVPQGKVSAPVLVKPRALREDAGRQAEYTRDEAARVARGARDRVAPNSQNRQQANSSPGFFEKVFGKNKAASNRTPGYSGAAYGYPEPTYTNDGQVVPMSSNSAPPPRSSSSGPAPLAPLPEPPSSAPRNSSSGPASLAPLSEPAPAPRSSTSGPASLAPLPDPPPPTPEPPRRGPASGRDLAPIAPSASVPVSVPAPYRVQFGAFRKVKHAEDFHHGMSGSGIPTMIVQSTANDLFLVVGRNGFATASDAQRWIETEGRRRGWTERPVVIR